MWSSYLVQIDLGDGPASPGRRAPETDLTLLFHSRLTKIWGQAGLPHLLLDDDRGIILGRLFQTGGAEVQAIDGRLSAGIRASHGDCLLEGYWGDYVLILDDPATDEVIVLRAPMGALPCYRMRSVTGLLLTSDVRLAARFGGAQPELDAPGLLRLLRSPNLREAGTALTGVTEVMPGHRIVVGTGDITETARWSPWRFADPDMRIMSPTETVGRLRETIVTTVGSLLSPYDRPLLAVSGGLDSSIVAAALVESGIDFAAVTLATREKAGDEREFARHLRDALAIELHERPESAELVDISISAAAHLPRPTARLFSQSIDRQMMRLASETGTGAFVHGGGGDNVFAYLLAVAPVADAIRLDGLKAGWTTARDIAALSGTGLPAVALRGLRRARRHGGYAWPTDDSFVSADGPALPLRPDSDWLASPRDVLPGKAMHVAWILSIQNRVEGYLRERERPNIGPLLAQPIVELCLRVPTPYWCTGGENRAIARRAFEHILPPVLLRRRSKGTPGSLHLELFDRHHDHIRETLLDGVIDRLGLIDRMAVEAAMQLPQPDLTTCNRLMTLFDTEIWARSWLNGG